MIACPHDNAPLIPNKKDDIDILACTDCEGSWYTHKNVMALKKTGNLFSLPDLKNEPSTPQKDGSTHLKCPQDNTDMDRYFFHAVEIDVCPTCSGIWLDRLEREKILSNSLPDHGGRGPWLIIEFLGYFLTLLK